MDLDNSTVVIVSGLKISDLMPLLGFRHLPEIWGCHGWERRKPDGSYFVWPAGQKHLKGLTRVNSMLKERNLDKYCEEKPRSLALHWRRVSQSEKIALGDFAKESLKKTAQEYDLELKTFDGGVELRIPGRNKGCAVETMIEEAPAGAFLAYLGDDLTDEDAFRAIKGRGVGILVGEGERDSEADYLIRTPQEFFEFLSNWDISAKGGAISDG